MPNFIDLTGKKFGSLTVLRYAGKRKNKICWECLCECGKTVILPAYYISSKSRKRRFCGKGGHSTVGEGNAAFNVFFSVYKHNAKRRKIEFNITKDEARYISQLPCHYCGNPPRNRIKSKMRRMIGDFVYSGIDRVDNTRGYVMDNIVPCCEVCNWMKRDFSGTEFMQHIKKIYTHRN
jgi:hypothetical protein